MTTIEDVNEALERVSVKGSRSHYGTPLEQALGEALAATSSFSTIDLITAILEAEGLGADTEERRRIAEALGWPVSNAMYREASEGHRQGFATCRAQVMKRLFG
jgi:hypothetical protein